MKDKKKEKGEHTFFDVEREEIGRTNLTNGIDLVVFMAGEHLDMRLAVDRHPYKGLSFYLPGAAYEGLKGLIEKVDKVCQERLEHRDILEGGGPLGGSEAPPKGYVTATI